MSGGSTSNITTQWTFRDGRDYILSLTTTETPNTVSFWISDKITGEEWTGTFDESAIEILTRRTGSYKNFQTFLAMIKSALLKKSDSVIVELLNIEDLTAISFHRQNQNSSTSSSATTDSMSNGNSSSKSMPLYFQLYGATGAEGFSCVMGKPPLAPDFVGKNNNNNNGKGGGTKILTSQQQQPHKRKYLIVTYIAEFDRVHYPLPLNYTSPPDLNVMQSNILALKAEVTSLKCAKKDLEGHLDTIKSGPVNAETAVSENKGNTGEDVNDNKGLGDPNDRSKESIQKSNSLQLQSLSRNGEGQNLASCHKCSELVNSLRSKINGLEEALQTQETDHSEQLANLEEALKTQKNHYLKQLASLEEKNSLQHQKIEASQKYEVELWTQIQALINKLSQTKVNEDKEKANARSHRSRHDLFYGKKPIQKSVGRGNTTKKPTKTPCILLGGLGSRSRSQKSEEKTLPCIRTRSRSNSTGSYVSVDTFVGRANSSSSLRVSRAEQVARRRRSETRSVSNNSRMSYRSLNFARSSISPSSRFDPTAYVAEKKLQQAMIADMRMQKIKDSLKLRDSGTRTPSPPASRSPRKKSKPNIKWRRGV